MTSPCGLKSGTGIAHGIFAQETCISTASSLALAALGALLAIVLALSAATPLARAAEQPKRSADCAKCATIARDYGKAWDSLSALLQEEADLKKQIAEIDRTFQAAYFGGDQADLDKWSKDSAAAERRATELPAEIESARKDLEARHADLLDCLRRDCFSAEARPSPPSDAGAEESCKACADNANRVAELTGQLVRLNEVAAQLEFANSGTRDRPQGGGRSA